MNAGQWYGVDSSSFLMLVVWRRATSYTHSPTYSRALHAGSTIPMVDCTQVWQAVLGELELLISKPNFTTWFKGTCLRSLDGDRVVVCVPNAFTKSWLEQKYHQPIQRALENVAQIKVKQIVYRVEVLRADDYRSGGAFSPHPQTSQKASVITPQVSPPATPASVNQFGLNQRYTFEAFVVGKGSELAHAACQAVAQAVIEGKSKPYNPLFIYGGVGLGKTHLLQAVGNHALKEMRDARIRYVTCEEFTNDFVTTIRAGNGKEFQDRYRSIDLLLIDDIQFIAGKEGTQEAFFHSFNHLHQHDKQVVLTSDRPPKAINALEKRLLSRFEWGMIADVQNPDLETRLAILDAKCRERNFVLSAEVMRYFATNVSNNVRELEGALNKFYAHVQFHKTPATLEVAREVVTQLTSVPRKTAITPKQLMRIVSEFYDVPISDLVGKSRKKGFVVPRQITMFLMREEMKSSYPAIGQEIGGRDHTTAMHAYDKIQNEIENNEKIRQDIQLIRQRLYVS
jgi:chromosomal replication initiator protein